MIAAFIILLISFLIVGIVIAALITDWNYRCLDKELEQFRSEMLKTFDKYRE